MLSANAFSACFHRVKRPRFSAGVPTGNTFGVWTPKASSIPAPTQQALRTLEWVYRRENLVVCGPPGTGKTFLLEALRQHAVAQGLRVAWFTFEDLGVLLCRHRADDTVTKTILASCEPTWWSLIYAEPATMPVSAHILWPTVAVKFAEESLFSFAEYPRWVRYLM